jgi:hypothetical protein
MRIIRILSSRSCYSNKSQVHRYSTGRLSMGPPPLVDSQDLDFLPDQKYPLVDFFLFIIMPYHSEPLHSLLISLFRCVEQALCCSAVAINVGSSIQQKSDSTCP